jgi:hypothetical protein
MSITLPVRRIQTLNMICSEYFLLCIPFS